MKSLREYIKKEIKRLKEATVKRPLPDEAKDALFNLLNLWKTHINGIQAVKSIKPTYKALPLYVIDAFENNEPEPFESEYFDCLDLLKDYLNPNQIEYYNL